MGVVCSVCKKFHDIDMVDFLPRDPRNYYELDPVCKDCQEKEGYNDGV